MMKWVAPQTVGDGGVTGSADNEDDDDNNDSDDDGIGRAAPQPVGVGVLTGSSDKDGDGEDGKAGWGRCPDRPRRGRGRLGAVS